MEVWKKETQRAKIKIVTSFIWKGGIPIDPKIPKWLVKIEDKLTKDNFCPTDEEFEFIGNTYDAETLGFIIEAFQTKENHNKANLKNPESRKKEEILSTMLAQAQEKKIIQLKFR